MRWIYATIGEPMWEFTLGPAEQSVMFYAPDPPFSTGGPAPMTDADWARLEASNRRRAETVWDRQPHTRRGRQRATKWKIKR